MSLPIKVAKLRQGPHHVPTPKKKKTAGDTTQAGAGDEAGGDDSEMSDEGLADALAAKLQAADGTSKGQADETGLAHKFEHDADGKGQLRSGRRRRDSSRIPLGEA